MANRNLIELNRDVVASGGFQQATTTLILLTAILMGLETSSTLMETYGSLFHVLNGVIQTLFVVEITLRFLACWPKPQDFFRSGWNVFDFLIVACSLLPGSGPFAMVARLARLLRVARLASVVPELRLIVKTLLRTIPSMGYIFLLIGLIFYIYGILGFHLFSKTDPEKWGSLGTALLTLFEILTLEGWVDIMNSSGAGTPFAWVFFVSFIVLAVFVVVNLFIAVIVNNLENAREEDAAVRAKEDATQVTPEQLAAKIDELHALLESLRKTKKETS